MADVAQGVDTESGRHVVIAGVSGGIGQAVLSRFRDDRIVAVDLTRDRAESALRDAGFDPDGGDCLALGADFADAAAVDAAVREIRRFSKSIDVVVNCVGIAEDAAFPMLSVESMQRQLQVNFIAAMQVCQAAVRLMAKKRKGSIVNVTSVTGLDGNPGQVAYGASKAALINATSTMSMELGPMGIRVNAVAPGVIDTAMTRAVDRDKLTTLKGRIHMGRLGEPEEIAEVIHWLTSDSASYVAGQTIRVDGCM